MTDGQTDGHVAVAKSPLTTSRGTFEFSKFFYVNGWMKQIPDASFSSWCSAMYGCSVVIWLVGHFVSIRFPSAPSVCTNTFPVSYALSRFGRRSVFKFCLNPPMHLSGWKWIDSCFPYNNRDPCHISSRSVDIWENSGRKSCFRMAMLLDGNAHQ